MPILGKCDCIYPVEKRDLLTILRVDIIQSENGLKKLNKEYDKVKDITAKEKMTKRISYAKEVLKKSKRLKSKIENTPECKTRDMSLL